MIITKDSIELTIMDNWHAHFRADGRQKFMVQSLVTSGWQGRVVAMPNLDPPVLTGEQAIKYGRNLKSMTRCKTFEPVVTIQITEETTPEIIFAAKKLGVQAAKVYPRDVTTNSKYGVRDYKKIYPALRAAEECGMIVLFHGESPESHIEGKNKERHFICWKLIPIRKEFPNLRIVLEHITSAFAVKYVKETPGVHATIAIQYLIATQDDVIGYTPESQFKGDPHLLCKPMHKWRRDREALQEAAFSGNSKFFYGGDDAPHYKHQKECAHCNCGVFNTVVAMPLLIDLFKKNNCLEKIEPFTSVFGAECYGYSINKETITFVRSPWIVPSEYKVQNGRRGQEGVIVPLFAGKELEYQVAA